MASYIRSATVISVFIAVTISSVEAVPAFPGAVGFGAIATGGRGGDVYHVTTLDDTGAGSFRDAVSHSNRVIVFDVGGYITLQSPLEFASNITVAGQTAPGGGIGVRGRELSLTKARNIIIRNVRVRQGRLDPDVGKSALNMGLASEIILDSCSFSYGQWDSLDAVQTHNFTVQNSIISFPIGQQFGAHVEGGPATFYQNLWVSAHNRQPLAKANTQFINNVLYNFELGYTSGNTAGYFLHDIIGNYFIAGPSTATPADAYFQMNEKQSAYAVANMLDASKDGSLDGKSYNTVGDAVTLSAPWAATTSRIPTLSNVDAYAQVVASAGASPQDEVDAFAVSDTASLGLRGQLYKDQNATGISNDGYGSLANGQPFRDTNGDGIADYWAAANNISVTDPAAGNAPYGTTGYSNLEVYINSLILPRPWRATNLPATVTAGAASFNTFTQRWLLTGSGTAARAGEGQFVARPWTKVDSVTARLVELHSADTAAAAGILVRSTGDNGTSFIALTVNASHITCEWRSNSGILHTKGIAQSITSTYISVTAAPNNNGCFISDDGKYYAQIAAPIVSFSEMIQTGITVTSGSNKILGTATFTNLTSYGISDKIQQQTHIQASY